MPIQDDYISMKNGIFVWTDRRGNSFSAGELKRFAILDPNVTLDQCEAADKIIETLNHLNKVNP